MNISTVKKWLLFSAITLTLLSGCVKLPPPKDTSQSLYPKKMRNGTPILQSDADFSRLMWWKKMHDPQLNRLIALALNNNNQIQSAAQNVLQARAQLKASYYAWIPTLGFNTTGFMVRTWDSNLTPLNPGSNAFLGNVKNLKLQGYFSGFTPNYSFNILENIYNTRQAKASLSSAKASLQSIKLSVISQITGAYFMLASQKAQLKQEKQRIRDQMKLRRLEKVRFQAGANDIETVVSLNQSIAQNEENLPKISNTISQTENAIHILLNQNPGPVRGIRTIKNIPIQHLIPTQLPSGVLKHRPDVMQASENVEMERAQIGVAYSAFFPTISLTNFIGSASVTLENLLKTSPQFWLGQLAAAMDIINPSSYQKIKEAKAAYFAAYYEYIQTLRSVFADVDNSLTNHTDALKTYQRSKKAAEAAREAYQLAKVQYQAGSQDERTVIEAKLNLDNAELDLVEKKAQVLDSIVQVYESVGGGYNTLPS